MNKKIFIFVLSFFCADIQALTYRISPNFNPFWNQTITWTSVNSSNTLTIATGDAYFTVHLHVDAASNSSISFTCASNAPVIIPAGSSIVCFVDSGSSASWASSSGVNPATGTYELLT